MAFLWALTAILLFPVGDGMAQAGAQAAPSSGGATLLHRRSRDEDQGTDAAAVTHGRSTLPADVSGEYLLGQSGESIEIDLQPNRLDGYISRAGQEATDEGAPLTYFFATCRLDGSQLGFSTRLVHGIWFSFEGTIVRGSVDNKARDGYYRLQGVLTLHKAGSQQSRNISLPLARQE